jgi:hypothetical protein
LGSREPTANASRIPPNALCKAAGLTTGSTTTADQAYGHTDKQRRRKESQ